MLFAITLGFEETYSAEETRLQVGFWAQGYDACDSSRTLEQDAYLVGGTYDLYVTLYPDGNRASQVKYTGISDSTWPPGLVIEIGQSPNRSGPCTFSALLLAQMELEYYVSPEQMRYDSVWRATGKSPPRLRTAPEYHFAFRVPQEFAGSYLCVSAKWSHPQYGYLEAQEIKRIKILIPCSEEALHHVWTSQVEEKWQQGRFDSAVQLADSFINLGWHNISGLMTAKMAANEIQRYDDAIRFLDTCFEANHTLDPNLSTGTLSMPSDAERLNYERIRARLIELNNQQQQR